MLISLSRNRASLWSGWRVRRQDWQGALHNLPLRLLQQPGSDAPLQQLLALLPAALGARHAALLLPQAGGWRQLGASGELADCPLHGAAMRAGLAGVQLCSVCQANGRYHLVCGLELGEERQALLLLAYPRLPGRAARAELAAVAVQLAEVLRAFSQDRQLRRRELAAERGVLARELHDSVAQQLAYLQIRACRLQAVLAQPAAPEQVDAMLVDLRQTLQLMHRQVRELISTARLTMDGCTLRQALEATVEEFARRSSCVFALDNRLPDDALGSEAELQILQIIREALANVVRHSHARRVLISLRAQAAGGIEVQVRDDGVGMPGDLPSAGHFGLRIMRERAAAIGAQLQILPQQPHGTCIQLCWRRA
jgi:two-component system nitrate/nitrite sensor histidine kinase NarX